MVKNNDITGLPKFVLDSGNSYANEEKADNTSPGDDTTQANVISLYQSRTPALERRLTNKQKSSLKSVRTSNASSITN